MTLHNAGIPASLRAGHEKTAFLSTLRTGGKLLGKLMPGNLTRAANPYLTQGQNKLVGAINKAMPGSGQTARTVLNRVPRAAAYEGIAGAQIGGLLGGTVNAAAAEPGDRTKAFISGFGSGALTGGLSGAVGGAGAQAVRNLGRSSAMRDAARFGTSPKAVASQYKNLGNFKSIRNLASSKASPLDKSLSRNKLLTGAGMTGSYLALPELVTPSEETPKDQPQPLSQPPLLPNAPSTYTQPQYYKLSSEKTALRPIDFEKIPSYHK